MALTLIKKRSGSIVTFDASRITSAISRAYIANQKPLSDDELEALTTQVVRELDYTYATDEVDGEVSIPSVEDIQDIVERVIAQHGDFDIAKDYILFRQQRAELRYQKQQEMLDLVNKSATSVKKRSGKIVGFDVKEIEQAIENVSKAFGGVIPVEKVVTATKLNIYDGITTTEITKAIILALKPFVERDPKYSYISARFLANELYKQVLGTDEFTDHFNLMHAQKFPEMIKKGIEEKRIDKRFSDTFDIKKLASVMVPARDQLFEFMGLQVLYDRYFVRTEQGDFLETPQYFWMRVAMGMSLLEKNPTETAIEFYHVLSQLLYVPSTPTLLHSGTVHPQMSSCFLSTVDDDFNPCIRCTNISPIICNTS
jgi:ribonucleoside-diphosphate reductase alpha chain